MKQQFMLVFALFAILMFVGTEAWCEVVIKHSGANDPEEEGWTVVSSGADINVGPVFKDPCSGYDAWFIDDNETMNEILLYRKELTPEQKMWADLHGWKLTIILRVVDFPTELVENKSNHENSIYVNFQAGDGGQNATLSFGSGPEDIPRCTIVRIEKSHLGAGPMEYLRFEMSYRPESSQEGKLNLAVNGKSRFSFSNAPINGAGPIAFLEWGANGPTTTGRGNWNLVQLEIFPDPEPPKPVYFADPNLKAVVEKTLIVTNPTTSHMLNLRKLYAPNKGIIDITGLEYAQNLQMLYLQDNQMSDIAVLSSLKKIFQLAISNNHISDLSPLCQTYLMHLSAENNQIFDISPLSRMEKMRILRLSGNNISNISVLSGMKNLQELNLSDNPLNATAYRTYLPLLKKNNPHIKLDYDDPNLVTK